MNSRLMEVPAEKKLLVLGAGIFQVPVIEAARAMGIYVVSLSNLPLDPGHVIANKSYLESTLNKEEVLKIAIQEKVNGIITIASEIAAPTVAWVAEKMGLPGYSYKAAITIANKLRLREFLRQHGLSDIQFADASTPELAKVAFSRLQKPLMLKPLIASGSKGIRQVQNLTGLEQQIEKTVSASFLEKGALLEEYKEGRAIGASVLLQNGCIAVQAVSEKTFNSHFVTTSHLMPARLTSLEKTTILNLLQSTAQKLELTNGALDADIVLTEKGPEIIELGGRLGGNALSKLASLHTGINYPEAAIKLALGLDFTFPNQSEAPVAVHIIGSQKPGTLKNIKTFASLFPNEKENLVQQSVFVKPGEKVEVYSQGNYQLGNVILTAPTIGELAELLDRVQAEEWAVVS